MMQIMMQIIGPYFVIYTFEGLLNPDLYGLAHVAGWEPCKLHALAHVAWVGSVLYRSRTTSHNGRLGCAS